MVKMLVTLFCLGTGNMSEESVAEATMEIDSNIQTTSETSIPNVADEDTPVTSPPVAMSSMAAQGTLENANNWEDNLIAL